MGDLRDNLNLVQNNSKDIFMPKGPIKVICFHLVNAKQAIFLHVKVKENNLVFKL